jgi:hypothetical protein
LVTKWVEKQFKYQIAQPEPLKMTSILEFKLMMLSLKGAETGVPTAARCGATARAEAAPLQGALDTQEGGEMRATSG